MRGVGCVRACVRGSVMASGRVEKFVWVVKLSQVKKEERVSAELVLT